MAQKDAGAHYIRHTQAVGRIIRNEILVQARDGSFSGECAFKRTAALVFIQQHCALGAVLLFELTDIFAKVGKCLVMRGQVIPKETRACKCKRVVSVLGIAAAVVAGPVGIVGLGGLSQPLMAIGAVSTVGVEVIQQHILAGELALVGDDVVLIGVQCGIPVALAQ